MRTTSFLILLSAHSSLCFGDTLADNLKELNTVQAERQANLQSIVAQIEHRYKDGTSGISELIEAKINLHKHERESESSAQGKIGPQQKILELEEKKHALMAQMMQSGKVSSLELLKSKERVLAAKQLLLQNKVQARSNIATEVKKVE